MGNTTNGVNENGGVHAPDSNSPIDQTHVQNESEENGQGNQSAGTLNADKKVPETVPYQRFKEINDKNKQNEDLLRAYEENLAALAVINQLAEEDPDFANEFKTIIDKSVNKKTKPANQENQKTQSNDPLLERVVKELEELKADKKKNAVLSAIDHYDAVLEDRAKNDVPSELRAAFDDAVARRTFQYTKGAPTAFDQHIFDKAYSETLKTFEPVITKLRPNETVERKVPPPPISGQVPKESTSVPRTFEERREFIRKAFETGKIFGGAR